MKAKISSKRKGLEDKTAFWYLKESFKDYSKVYDVERSNEFPHDLEIVEDGEKTGKFIAKKDAIILEN